MIRRTVIAVMATAFLGLLGFVVLSWRPAIAPVERPNPASFTAESISKGEVLAAVGHCVSCHTRPGGQPFAGGYGVNTPFGIIYGSNITPDPKTGIGLWSLEAFARAMREGIARDGSHLFAAFPYNVYTGLWDEDVKALYAYLMTRPPVSATVPANSVPFPLSIRSLEEGWKILFFRSERYRPDPAKSEEWNRGAYLAQALSDCEGCHTPRNALGALKARDPYAGATIDGWVAPALTEANPSPVPWTQGELFSYLRTGVGALHGATAGPMTPVIRGGLSAVPDADNRALAIYFADIDHADAREPAVQAAVSRALATSPLGSGQEYDPDARLYAAACIGCHYNAGPTPLPTRPELALNSALTLHEPTNFIQVVLKGVSHTEGASGLVMPGYASALTDADIARLAGYLRRTRTDRPPWTDVEKKVDSILQNPATSQ